MPSKKQIQYRLESKKTKFNNATRDMVTAEKGKKTILLRKLTQERASLDRDIKRLERQLIMEIKVSKEKKALNFYQNNV